MPNFFGGLAQGLQAGDLNGAVDYLIKQRQARKVAEALSNTMGGGGAPPAQPGQTDPIAALAKLTGGTGAPPQAAPAPAPRAGPGPAPQRDPLAPLPAPAPRPQPMPGQPTGAPGAEAPTGAAVDPKISDPFKEGQSIIKNIWQATRAANPKADPRTILAAVETQLDEVKGVAPITKAVMQGQIQVLKSQSDLQFKTVKLQAENEWFYSKMNELAKHHASQEEFWKATEEHQRRVDAINEQRADTYEESTQDTHEDRQSAESGRNSRNAANNTTREDIAGESNQTRRDISEQRSEDSTYRSDQSFRGAQVRSGQTPDPAPQRGAPRAGPRIPPNVAQFAKQHGLTVIRRRADGKWDAKDKNGTVGVIG